MTTIRRAMKESKSIVELVKDVKIYQGIINTKEAWEKLPSETIVKCFKQCSIHTNMYDGCQPLDNTSEVVDREPDEFDRWFADLLEVPWEDFADNDKLFSQLTQLYTDVHRMEIVDDLTC